MTLWKDNKIGGLIPPQETDADQSSSNENNNEDRIPLKQLEKDNDEDRNLSDKSKEEDRIPPTNKNSCNKQKKFQELYAEVCADEDTDEIILFNERNYKVAISAGLGSSRIRPVKCVLDTGVGPNLLRENLVEPD